VFTAEVLETVTACKFGNSFRRFGNYEILPLFSTIRIKKNVILLFCRFSRRILLNEDVLGLCTVKVESLLGDFVGTPNIFVIADFGLGGC